MNSLDRHLDKINRVFKNTADKREAHRHAWPILEEMSGDKQVFTEVLRRHVQKRGSLNVLHYPVVGIDIELNDLFGLVANCWIPLPNRETNISSKSIHHHGDMLLSTVTAHGTGYEHWTFETPAVVDPGTELYTLKLIENAAHPLHHVAFVDAYIAHLPLYPPDCTVTYALWSSQFPSTWRDSLKRVPILQANSERLRKIAVKVGLKKALELKVVEYFDFYPCVEGFKGLRERKEFERSSNEDYLYSLFFVIQKTQNEELFSLIREKLQRENINDRPLVEKLLLDLQAGKDIEGRIGHNHFGFEYANFSREQILQSLAAQK